MSGYWKHWKSTGTYSRIELKMNIRAMQILGFLQTVLGWIFIACSLAMEGWKVATTGGQGGSAVVIVGWYWSSLWRVCSTFSNNVSTCHDFPVLWSVESSNMNHTLMMYMEIGCFVCCLYGWILNCSTLATEYWNFSEVSEDVLTTINFFSNLWMDCVSDTTGASDCKYYASMMALPGFSGMIVYSMWGHKTRSEFVDSNYMAQNSNKSQHWSYVYMRSPSRGSYMTAQTRGTYRIPASSKHTRVIMSPLFQSGRNNKGSRTQNTQRIDTNRTARVPVSLNMDSYV
ncbi:hypothetical protein P4O66_007090 [Electrophorus voltai]|uniref:Claudin n=1 Tax=Electrophorus voltai TaxID=2609070 RepID=A0AAD8ZG43_9TELE|nr:hypothetical protein P4O66_007090 [Electrophorus voltai]